MRVFQAGVVLVARVFQVGVVSLARVSPVGLGFLEIVHQVGLDFPVILDLVVSLVTPGSQDFLVGLVSRVSPDLVDQVSPDGLDFQGSLVGVVGQAFQASLVLVFQVSRVSLEIALLVGLASLVTLEQADGQASLVFRDSVDPASQVGLDFQDKMAL